MITYDLSSPPSTFRSGMFGIFLLRYAVEILSNAWKEEVD